MGWSLRKSFKLGPTRLNVSSRGIGYSVGVRGLRIGARAGGRGYVSGGRGMLRFQSNLGSSSSSASSYSTPFGSSSSGTSGAFIGCLGLFGLFFFAIGAIAFAGTRVGSDRSVPVIIALIGAGFVVGAVWLWLNARRKRSELAAKQQALDDYVSAARALAESPKLVESDVRHVLSLRREVSGIPEDLGDEFKTAYREAVAEAVADQHVTPQEQGRLALIARGLSLPRDAVKEANRAGFLEGVLALIKDCKLTETEEGKIEQMRVAFAVNPAEVKAQLAKVDELKRARVIDETEELLPIDSGVKLKTDEVCYYMTPVTEMKHRVVRAWVEDGEKQTERALEAERSGDLYVTSERLLFVTEGTVSIKSDSIMKIYVEPKPGATSEAVALTVDGRKTPHYFDAPEPFVLLAHILHVAKRRRKGGAAEAQE